MLATFQLNIYQHSKVIFHCYSTLHFGSFHRNFKDLQYDLSILQLKVIPHDAVSPVSALSQNRAKRKNLTKVYTTADTRKAAHMSHFS